MRSGAMPVTSMPLNSMLPEVGGMAPATSEDGVFAVKLLDQERLEQAQNGDAGFEMRDVLGVIGFRRVAAHIGGMRNEIADSDGKGSKACGHGISFQVGEMRPARLRVTNPRLQGSPRQKAHFPFEGSVGLEFSDRHFGKPSYPTSHAPA